MSKSDKVTLKQLCEVLGLDPGKAQRKLREAFGKVDYQWEWSKDSEKLAVAVRVLLEDYKPLSPDTPLVAVIMGSRSDWDIMRNSIETLEKLDISCEAKVISAHRTPARLESYVSGARERGLKVFIAGAGMAAALPGAIAALTPLPVFGVPLPGKAFGGMDSLLATVQMPGGIPVGALAVGKAGAINAALLAASVLGLGDKDIAAALDNFRAKQTAGVPENPED